MNSPTGLEEDLICSSSLFWIGFAKSEFRHMARRATCFKRISGQVCREPCSGFDEWMTDWLDEWVSEWMGSVACVFLSKPALCPKRWSHMVPQETAHQSRPPCIWTQPLPCHGLTTVASSEPLLTDISTIPSMSRKHDLRNADRGMAGTVLLISSAPSYKVLHKAPIFTWFLQSLQKCRVRVSLSRQPIYLLQKR